MSKPTTNDVLYALCHAWERVSEAAYIKTNACILASRVGVEALSYFGVLSRVMPMKTIVQNAKLVEQLNANVAIDWSTGAHGVGVDPDLPSTDTGWNGHMCIAVPSVMLFVDLTLPQFSRPEKDIVMSPIVASYDDAFLQGGTAVYRLNNCRVIYEFRPDLRGTWEHSSDGRKNISTIAGPVIRSMREILSEAKSE